jgi:hypothetical protein
MIKRPKYVTCPACAGWGSRLSCGCCGEAGVVRRAKALRLRHAELTRRRAARATRQAWEAWEAEQATNFVLPLASPWSDDSWSS